MYQFMEVGFSAMRARETFRVLDTWDVLRVDRVVKLLLCVR